MRGLSVLKTLEELLKRKYFQPGRSIDLLQVSGSKLTTGLEMGEIEEFGIQQLGWGNAL